MRRFVRGKLTAYLELFCSIFFTGEVTAVECTRALRQWCIHCCKSIIVLLFSDPPTFKTEPVSIKAKLNQRVRLTCSYQNFTQIKSFQWLKDGRAYDPPKLQVLEGRFPRAVSPDSTKYLDVQGSDPEVQGYYTCMVKDALNNTVKSKESLVHFTGKSDL